MSHNNDDDDDNNNNNNNNNNKKKKKKKKEEEEEEEEEERRRRRRRRRRSMWKVKTRVIPVIIGATGTISKSFRKYIRNIPGNHEVKELQEIAILGTAHILR